MNASIVELHGVPGIADMFDQYPVILIIVRYIVYALGRLRICSGILVVSSRDVT